MATPMMTLFCWVFGDPQPFPVKISLEETVGELKEAIAAKNPNRFQVSYALNLWKKIITTSDIKTFQLSDLNEEDELDETWRIVKYFKEAPEEEKIHVIIKAPSIEGKFY